MVSLLTELSGLPEMAVESYEVPEESLILEVEAHECVHLSQVIDELLFDEWRDPLLRRISGSAKQVRITETASL